MDLKAGWHLCLWIEMTTTFVFLAWQLNSGESCEIMIGGLHVMFWKSLARCSTSRIPMMIANLAILHYSFSLTCHLFDLPSFSVEDSWSVGRRRRVSKAIHKHLKMRSATKKPDWQHPSHPQMEIIIMRCEMETLRLFPWDEMRKMSCEKTSWKKNPQDKNKIFQFWQLKNSFFNCSTAGHFIKIQDARRPKFRSCFFSSVCERSICRDWPHVELRSLVAWFACSSGLESRNRKPNWHANLFSSDDSFSLLLQTTEFSDEAEKIPSSNFFSLPQAFHYK